MTKVIDYIKEIWFHAKNSFLYGDWVYGFEDWEGKPRLAWKTFYYDGNGWILHFWKFYVGAHRY